MTMDAFFAATAQYDAIWERREALRSCVDAPAIGMILPWTEPSFFNAESLIATIGVAGANAPAAPPLQAASVLDQHRPDKRTPLPILSKTVGPDGSVLCGPQPGLSLRLDELLGQGFDTPSFVYRCTVLPHDHTVVLKLLTDQNDKLPASTYIPQEVYANQQDFDLPGQGQTAQYEICNEADRFKDLELHQGMYVPFSYGFYEFLLPDGHSVPAHIMEFVPTVDIRESFQRACVSGPQAIDQFLTALHCAYAEIHMAGVLHCDPGIRNLCLLPTSDQRLQFVILDFTAGLSLPYAEARGLSWSEGEQSLMYRLYENLGEGVVEEWFQTENGKRMEKLCLMSPTELAKEGMGPVYKS